MEQVSDGCTGFWLFERIWPSITQCCSLHDTGATDGFLLDCLQGALPSWTWPVAALCVAIMVLLRPVYNFIKRKISK